MFKKCLLILITALMAPAFAEDLENALVKGHNVFLYLYTHQCGYCTKFTPYYNKLAKVYDGQYNFIKVDAMTPYGFSLMRNFEASYVPFVVLINSKKDAIKISPSCLMEAGCVEAKMKEFRK